MSDLESQLRQDARRFGPTADADLAARIRDRLAAHRPAADLPPGRHPLMFPLVWTGVAAAAALVLAIGLAGGRDEAPGPATQVAQADPQPPVQDTPAPALPHLDLSAAWKLAATDPLSGELALLGDDVRSVGRFLAERLPRMTVAEQQAN